MNEIGIILSILGCILLFGYILWRLELWYVDPADIVRPVHKIKVYIAPMLLAIAFFSVIILALSGIFEWIWVVVGCLIAGLSLLGWSYSSVSPRPAPINRFITEKLMAQKEQYLKEYTQAIAQDHGNISAYYDRGSIYSQLGDYDRAIADFNKCLELDPQNHGAYVNRGICYLLSNKPDQALLDINQAIALGLNDPEDLYNRGFVYLMKEDFDLALDDFDAYLVLVPDNVDGYYKRANAHYGKKDFHRALSDLNRALQINPNDAAVHLKRGQVYGELGKRKKAISDLKRARTLGLPPKIDRRAEEQIRALKK